MFVAAAVVVDLLLLLLLILLFCENRLPVIDLNDVDGLEIVVAICGAASQ